MSSQPSADDMAGRWLAGELSLQEEQQWQAMLAQDPAFAAQMRSLDEVARALRDLPPELFMDGPSDGAQLMARRVAAAAARTERDGTAESVSRGPNAQQSAPGRSTTPATPARRERWWLAAAACVLVAAAAGVVAGATWERRASNIAAPAPTVTVTATPTPTPPPANVVTAANRNDQTGAAMRVRLTPAAGWVRVQVTVTGIPAGQRCRIWVVSAKGTRELAGSWLVSPKGAQEGTTLDGSAIVDPNDVTDIIIENTTGTRYVNVPI